MPRKSREIDEWIKSQGGVEAIREGMAQHGKDWDFLQEHRRSWMALYPDKWVAVYREELVGVAETLPKLLEKLQGKQIPANETICDFLDTKDTPLILLLSCAVVQIAA